MTSEKTPTRRITRTALALSALTLLFTSAWLTAGPLDPPAGPVTSTHKTLTEVEPRIAINATNTPGDADSLYKITQPGSYYLTGNITGVNGKHGIEIMASGVTLDLNGFDLVGTPGMGAFDGVSVTVDSLRSITVLSGSVRNWGDGGVDLGFLSRGCRVDGVLASGNAGTGISSSIASTVTNCTAVFNGQRGIRASNGSTISDCAVESNSGNGIEVNHGCTIASSSAYFNTSNGILTGSGTDVIDCAAYQNMADGIRVTDGCLVADCTAQSNTNDGIQCSEACTIRGDTCSFNGIGAGIHVTGSRCRVEGNSCVSNLRGVEVAGTDNIIIKNTCAANTTNWVIAGLNLYGPIVDSATVSPPVSGNSAFSTLGTTDPNANFTHE